MHLFITWLNQVIVILRKQRFINNHFLPFPNPDKLYDKL